MSSSIKVEPLKHLKSSARCKAIHFNIFMYINALARASDLKTTPPTDKEPPLADRKRRGKSDACQCVLYMYLHLMMVMGTTIHYFA